MKNYQFSNIFVGKVFDHDLAKTDDPLGSVEVPVYQLRGRQELPLALKGSRVA